MKIIVFAFTLFVDTTYMIFAQEAEPLIFETSYVGDNVNNFSGGIKTGSRYLGMANIRLGFDMEKAGLWKGGLFYINAANTHGAIKK